MQGQRKEVLQREGGRACLGGKMEERLGGRRVFTRVRQHGRTFIQQTRSNHWTTNCHTEELQAQKWDPGDQPSPKEMAGKEGEMRKAPGRGSECVIRLVLGLAKPPLCLFEPSHRVPTLLFERVWCL